MMSTKDHTLKNIAITQSRNLNLNGKKGHQVEKKASQGTWHHGNINEPIKYISTHKE